jgi:hypothetical protein
MTTNTNRLGLIVILSLLTCILLLNGLRPVHGQPQEGDLKKQVESLTKRVDEQQKKLDTLRIDYEKSKAGQDQWDNATTNVITQHGNAIQNINARLVRARL